MVYYSQKDKEYETKKTDYRCGAYAIAYWEWKDAEEQGIPYNNDKADSFIQVIYSRIWFTKADIDNMKILPDLQKLQIDWNIVRNYSSPAKMCEDLNLSSIRREQGTKAIIYTSKDSIVKKLGSIGNITKPELFMKP